LKVEVDSVYVVKHLQYDNVGYKLYKASKKSDTVIAELDTIRHRV